jgi:hypothetical protein
MFDPAAIAARELLSHFGKNTAIRIDHRYGRNEIRVCVARTGNEIMSIEYGENFNAEAIANEIKGMRKFPKPRNMKRAWSPIRLSEKAIKEAEIFKATIGGYYMNVDPA